MPLDATRLYGTDTNIPTLHDLALEYVTQAQDIRDAEDTHSEVSKYIFDAWLRLGELIWTARNVADIPVSKFRKAIAERGGKPLDRATAYNLIAFYEKRETIIKKCKKEEAEANDADEHYIWPGWYGQLAKLMGRKDRDEFPSSNAEELAKTLIVDELQKQLTEERKGRAIAEQKTAELQEKLDEQFRGRMSRKAGSDNRPTLQYVFDHLNAMHDFDWDVCASAENTKVEDRFFDIALDALKQEWRFRCGWMNPPYTAEWITAFLKKAIAELRAVRCLKIVALLPVWTDAPWFSGLVSHGHIEFVTGRLSFLNGETGNVMDASPWPSMVVTLTATSVSDGNKLSAAIIDIPRPKNYLSGTRKRIAKPTPESDSMSSTEPESDPRPGELHTGVATMPNVAADIAAPATPKGEPNVTPDPAPEPKSKPYIGPTLIFGGMRPCPKTSAKMGRQLSTETHPDDPLATAWQIDGDRLPDIGGFIEHYIDKAKAQAALRRYVKKFGIVPSLQEPAPDYLD